MESKRRLTTTGSAARALGIDPATLWRWYQAGRVRPAWVTPGGHARWDLADLRHQLDVDARGEMRGESESATDLEGVCGDRVPPRPMAS